VYTTIRTELDEGIETITFDRADKLNAYIPLMGEEIVAAFERARDDAAVRAVILTGSGRAFCAGVDLEFLKAHLSGQDTGPGPKLGEEAFVRTWPLALPDYPKPVIAAINGPAYGVGVTMTLGCDVRLAARSAKLGLNFTRLGLLPGLGSTHWLPQLVGLSKALELVLGGATVSADEAERIGLIARAVPDAELLPEAIALARGMAECRPEVLAAAKHALRAGAASSLGEAIAEEQRLSSNLRGGAAR